MKLRTPACWKLSVAALVLVALHSEAATFSCDMNVQAYLTAAGAMQVIPIEQMRRRQASVIIEDEKVPFVERCSFAPSENKVTCDRYPIDRIEVDRNVNIKKFYLFRSQFDVQLFSNLTVVENNGRGGVAFGICTMVKP
jgi:hypothetical protein